jgi:hypothetical protein
MLRSRVAAPVASLGAAGVLAAGCGDDCGRLVDGCRRAVAEVRVAVSPKVIAVGETAQANAIAYARDAGAISSSTLRFRYTARTPGVASVDAATGVVTGVAPGRAAIVAEARGGFAADSVVVVARPD